MAKGCGCGVMQASGDPNGRSISSLKGIGSHGKKRKTAKRCRTVKLKNGKTKRVCSPAKKTKRKAKR